MFCNQWGVKRSVTAARGRLAYAEDVATLLDSGGIHSAVWMWRSYRKSSWGFELVHEDTQREESEDFALLGVLNAAWRPPQPGSPSASDATNGAAGGPQRPATVPPRSAQPPILPPTPMPPSCARPPPSVGTSSQHAPSISRPATSPPTAQKYTGVDAGKGGAPCAVDWGARSDDEGKGRAVRREGHSKAEPCDARTLTV